MFGRFLMFTLALMTGFTAAVVTSAPVFAQSHTYDVRPQASRLNADAITKTFSGLTHEGAYNFNRDGNPGNRYTEWHSADGGIIYREDGIISKGRWTTARDLMCYEYDNNALGSGCFLVYKLGTCFYFYQSQLIALGDALSRDYWTARSVEKGTRATCEDMIS